MAVKYLGAAAPIAPEKQPPPMTLLRVTLLLMRNFSLLKFYSAHRPKKWVYDKLEVRKLA